MFFFRPEREILQAYFRNWQGPELEDAALRVDVPPVCPLAGTTAGLVGGDELSQLRRLTGILHGRMLAEDANRLLQHTLTAHASQGIADIADQPRRLPGHLELHGWGLWTLVSTARASTATARARATATATASGPWLFWSCLVVAGNFLGVACGALEQSLNSVARVQAVARPS